MHCPLYSGQRSMRRRRKAFELQVRKPAEKTIDLLPMKAESVCIRILMVASVSSGVIRLVCRFALFGVRLWVPFLWKERDCQADPGFQQMFLLYADTE